MNKFNIQDTIYFIGNGDDIHKGVISTITLVGGRVAYGMGEVGQDNQPQYRLEAICFKTLKEAQEEVKNVVTMFRVIDSSVKEANEGILKVREEIFGKALEENEIQKTFYKAIKIDKFGKEVKENADKGTIERI